MISVELFLGVLSGEGPVLLKLVFLEHLGRDQLGVDELFCEGEGVETVFLLGFDEFFVVVEGNIELLHY